MILLILLALMYAKWLTNNYDADIKNEGQLPLAL